VSDDGRRHARRTLSDALRHTDDCLPIDRLNGRLSDVEQRHVDQCARCQAEIALWTEFRESTPAPNEGAAVEWIVAELRRRRERTPHTRRARWALTRWQGIGLGVAAVAAMVVGYMVSNREPGVRAPHEEQLIYRSGQIRVVKPIGELTTRPDALEWLPVEGAVRYDIRTLQVDRTLLWRASSVTPRLEIPPAVASRFVPGKTILWQVNAVNRDGQILATSGDHRFRVAVNR